MESNRKSIYRLTDYQTKIPTVKLSNNFVLESANQIALSLSATYKDITQVANVVLLDAICINF